MIYTILWDNPRILGRDGYLRPTINIQVIATIKYTTPEKGGGV